MKKLLCTLLFVSLVWAPSAHAFFYKAKCLVPEGKFKTCTLDFSKRNTLKIRYKKLDYQGLNKEIPGAGIQHIAIGEQAKRRWATVGVGIYALGPIGALFLLWKKKMAIFSVEYGSSKSPEAVLFGVPKKQGATIGNMLESISKVKVDYSNYGQAK
ncbi:MAG: hypothetical protein KDK66_06225 [Deltaproteobacteria bacterium]|nr:hypothetical protein [Deltaproteobacteria bacterium]